MIRMIAPGFQTYTNIPSVTPSIKISNLKGANPNVLNIY